MSNTSTRFNRRLTNQVQRRERSRASAATGVRRDYIPCFAYPSGPLWSTLTMALMICLSVSAVSTPTSATMSSWFAVNNFVGRA